MADEVHLLLKTVINNDKVRLDVVREFLKISINSRQEPQYL